ncbi:MAG: histidine--tRNA ligase, partial [Firmicutes bacterium]|nr:histidine--tRNA ligase [Bacillota bacterium]
MSTLSISPKIVPKNLPGFPEFLPCDQILFNNLKNTIKNLCESFGFTPMDTPILESADILLAKTGGDTEKQIYSFKKGNSEIAMRFDLTVPLAKYVALHHENLIFPFRRYQIGKVYRGERPQNGRFREFYQADVDIIGSNNLDIIHDVEIISFIYTTIREIGFNDFVIKINNRKILNGLFSSFSCNPLEIIRIVDKKNKIGIDGIKRELEKIKISSDNIETVIKFLNISETKKNNIDVLKSMDIDNQMFQAGKKELIEIFEGINKFGIPDSHYMLDLTIARGLDYYTGTIYETILKGSKIGSVCSGGRYDNLSEFYTNKKIQGVGVSFGLTRLFYQMNVRST